MPTNAIFGIVPAVWKWKYGQDREYLAETCYPLMLLVADFYDDYIGEPDENGRYNVYGSVHEGANWFAANDMFSLGAVRFLYREIIAASKELGRDADRRSHWQDILDNISEYHLQKWGDTITFRPDLVRDVTDAIFYQGGTRNTGLMFTTTFDNIGYSTLPAYKIATRKTLDRGNFFYPQRFSGWQDSNDFGMMFVMAVRAGYRPDRVIEAIKGWKPELNGFVSQKRGGGIETAGVVEAINNMLLQSHDGVIRVFPNWDRSVDAEFKRLRTVGAFLVNAKYHASDQKVYAVRIFSEKGNTCTVQSPFKGSCITVTRADNQQPVETVQDEEEFTFDTIAGVTYDITRAECTPAPAGSPVITAHPVNTTIELPAVATFTVSASGTGLSYQWQKNRADIQGATSPSYTTPPTTLWDIGSAYRCVISNSSGSVKSDPGILNPDDDSTTDSGVTATGVVLAYDAFSSGDSSGGKGWDADWVEYGGGASGLGTSTANPFNDNIGDAYRSDSTARIRRTLATPLLPSTTPDVWVGLYIRPTNISDAWNFAMEVTDSDLNYLTRTGAMAGMIGGSTYVRLARTNGEGAVGDGTSQLTDGQPTLLVMHLYKGSPTDALYNRADLYADLNGNDGRYNDLVEIVTGLDLGNRSASEISIIYLLDPSYPGPNFEGEFDYVAVGTTMESVTSVNEYCIGMLDLAILAAHWLECNLSTCN